MSNSEEFKNEKISVNLVKEPGCIVKMSIKANSEAAVDNWKKALKAVKKEVSFPGYRKGKAPDEMVLKNYEKQVTNEFKDHFLNEAARQAMELTRLFPWDREGKIKADIVSADKENGGEFTLEFESYPTVPSIDPSEIKVEKVEEKEITDKDVDDHILSLRYYHAKKEPVEDREVVEHDDYVEVSVKMVDGDQPERNTTFHVNNDYLQDWLYDFLIGKKVGETVELTPPKPEKKGDLTEDNIVEQLSDPRPFTVLIKKILKAELEELNDELAKKYGSESLEEFKTKVKDHLDRQAKKEAKNILQGKVQDRLAETCEFDLPASLFAEEKEQSLKKMIENFKMAQYSDEEIEKMKESIETVAAKHAKKVLVTHYILGKISEEQKFEISQDEIMQELIQQSMMQTGQVDPAIFENLENYANPVARRLQFVKAMDYLSDHVTVQ